MKEFTVGKNESGQRLDKLLTKILSQAPKSFIYKMLRKKNIVLNDKKTAGDEKTNVGDVIKIYLADETYEKFAGVKCNGTESIKASDNANENKRKASAKHTDQIRHLLNECIIYEDEDILAVNKPSGVLSQKAKPEDYSVNEWLVDYLLEKGDLTKQDLLTFRPSICNRLDRNTSGLLIAGKSLLGLQRMAEYLKERSAQKYYRCIVKGHIEDMHLKGYLVKDHSTNQVCISKTPVKDAVPIETSWRVIEEFQGSSLLEVHLITGKSHQIRAHLASVGHPILGDVKYGDKKWNEYMKKGCGVTSQLLHAYRMEFPDGRILTAPLPEEFQRAVDFCR